MVASFHVKAGPGNVPMFLKITGKLLHFLLWKEEKLFLKKPPYSYS